MGIWSGIKYAINSTLGTSEFEPLDKIIKGQRTYGASDSVIAVLSSSSYSALTSKYTESNTYTDIPNAEFSCTKAGSIRVIASLKAYTDDTLSSANCYLSVYENGKHIANTTQCTQERNNDGTESIRFDNSGEHYVDISIKAGSVYTFKLCSWGQGHTWCKGIKLGAQIVDLTMLDYTNDG